MENKFYEHIVYWYGYVNSHWPEIFLPGQFCIRISEWDLMNWIKPSESSGEHGGWLPQNTFTVFFSYFYCWWAWWSRVQSTEVPRVGSLGLRGKQTINSRLVWPFMSHVTLMESISKPIKLLALPCSKSTVTIYPGWASYGHRWLIKTLWENC